MASAVETEMNHGQAERMTPPVPPPGQLRSPRARWLVGGGALLLLVAITAIWRYMAVRESTDDAEIDGHVTPISARVGGTVVEVAVNDNQFVEAGTVLVKIDPRDYQVALDRAKGDLAEAEAEAAAARMRVPIATTNTGSELQGSEAGVEGAQAGVAAAGQQVQSAHAKQRAAQAQLEQARALDTKAARDLERLKPLVTKDEVSQQEYDGAVAAAQASHAAVESAEAGLAEAGLGVALAESQSAEARSRLIEARSQAQAARTAPQQVAVMRANAQSAQAKVEQRKAELEQMKLNMGYTVVKAPASGWVSKKNVQVGQVIAAGQPLLAIVPQEDLWVIANFKETQLTHMRPGQRAEISVDELGGRKFRGRVDSIAAATGEKFSILPPENATGNYVKVIQRVPVKIVFDPGQDPEHLLRPGLSVEPTVLTHSK
ncbi:MAG: HlyD family secretion protein [Acidobacteria bacterium]|nr:MAG: HlyD family secretion protein [Acidobacteriota bacterium]